MWEQGRWNDWLRDHQGEEDRLEELRGRPDDLRLDELMHVVLADYRTADSRIGRWVRILLGHDIGAHGAACAICATAEGREWWLVLRACGTNPRTMRNFRAALLDGNHVGPSHFEQARMEIQAEQGGDADDF